VKTYLSIDLDYWRRDFDREPWHAKRFFKRVWLLGLPIRVALHHHHLIRDINRIKDLDKVVNVDYHSDIVEEHEDYPHLELTEGTWANYVEHRRNMIFEWRYPSEECLDCGTGYCHTYRNPFEEDCTPWWSVRKKEGVARIPWSEICAVGVCLSPGWLDSKWVVNYPMECLQLYEWLGRWSVYEESGCSDGLTDAENGTGIFKPRLTRPKCVL
jgi:hypothetical protein